MLIVYNSLHQKSTIHHPNEFGCFLEFRSCNAEAMFRSRPPQRAFRLGRPPSECSMDRSPICRCLFEGDAQTSVERTRSNPTCSGGAELVQCRTNDLIRGCGDCSVALDCGTKSVATKKSFPGHQFSSETCPSHPSFPVVALGSPNFCSTCL